MKKLFIYCLLLLFSCKTMTATENLDGIYTAYHEHEFGKTHDTLIISHANDGDNIYSIVRRYGVVITVGGKNYPKKIMQESYMARYDEKGKILEELRTGKLFIYNSQKQTMVLGKTAFIKK